VNGLYIMHLFAKTQKFVLFCLIISPSAKIMLQSSHFKIKQFFDNTNRDFRHIGQGISFLLTDSESA